jgi:hypothetical protein
VKAGNRLGAATAGKLAVFGRHFADDVPRALHRSTLLGLLESKSIRSA